MIHGRFLGSLCISGRKSGNDFVVLIGDHLQMSAEATTLYDEKIGKLEVLQLSGRDDGRACYCMKQPVKLDIEIAVAM